MLQEKEDWAICFRTGLFTRGQDTNNIVEAVFRRIKDAVLCRVKAKNVLQLFISSTTVLSSHFASMIVDKCRQGK